MHTESSEPYYYEQVYKRVSAEFPIPVDRSGCARLFTARAKPTEKHSHTTQIVMTVRTSNPGTAIVTSATSQLT